MTNFRDNSDTRMGEPETTVVLGGLNPKVEQVPIFSNRRNPVLEAKWNAIHFLTIPTNGYEWSIDFLAWVTPTALLFKACLVLASAGVNVLIVLVPLLLLVTILGAYMAYLTGDKTSLTVRLVYLAVGIFLGVL